METIINKLFGFYSKEGIARVDELGKFLNRAAAESVKKEFEKKNKEANSPYTAFTITEDYEFLE